ncbi:hypothetical protein C9890_0652 [Perkinsus sp. BL_2016]|nr:hypothetical protein C9890_0652 [Perkinsus sp. BL_2016]
MDSPERSHRLPLPPCQGKRKFPVQVSRKLSHPLQNLRYHRPFRKFRLHPRPHPLIDRREAKPPGPPPHPPSGKCLISHQNYVN